MRQYQELRKAHPEFVYHSSSWKVHADNSLALSFHFSCGADLHFYPEAQVLFPQGIDLQCLNPFLLDTLVFHVGLAELPSYWKATCSPIIRIQAGYLDAEQIAFWRNLIIEGLGEFYYHNAIDCTMPDFVSFLIDACKPSTPPSSYPALDETSLLPLGGGKDSSVSLNLFAQSRFPFASFAINSAPATKRLRQLAQVFRHVEVVRHIHPRLLQLNEQGYLNGHAPFVSLVGFYAALAAILAGHKYVVFSNEASSNEPNVHYLGRAVNHQYPKSFAYEAAFHAYARRFLHPELICFSLLRPLNDLQIAQAFSRLTPYLPAFRSCNKGLKTDTWCQECAKCVSTYATLAPFLSQEALEAIFADNLLQRPGNEAVLASLLGQSPVKPFECVATAEEMQCALALQHKDPAMARRIIAALTKTHSPHLIPPHFYALLEPLFHPLLEPLLPISNILVLGFGLSGQSALRFLLQRLAAPRSITVADQNPSLAALVQERFSGDQDRIRIVAGPSYMSDLSQYDLIFKTPGIGFHVPEIASLDPTQTILASTPQFFFELCRGTIIGVTGTKGKSTTASLIYHVLRTNNLPVELVGNIGIPELDRLGENDPETIYCFELSQQHLYNLYKSPHIAVLLDIFPDHLDIMRDFADYVAAKAHITRFQKRRDHLIFNGACALPRELSTQTSAQLHPFDRSCPPLITPEESPLLGTFNYQNIWPSVVVGRLLGFQEAEIAAAIRSFQPLKHRLELIACIHSIRFYEDIRSTAPEVTCAAIEALQSDPEYTLETLFLGGKERYQDYSKLVEPIKHCPTIKNIILFPDTGHRIEHVLSSDRTLARTLRFFHASTMEQAVRLAYQETSPYSICLLSTAAPSTNLFRSGEEKGELYRYWIQRLADEALTPPSQKH